MSVKFVKSRRRRKLHRAILFATTAACTCEKRTLRAMRQFPVDRDCARVSHACLCLCSFGQASSFLITIDLIHRWTFSKQKSSIFFLHFLYAPSRTLHCVRFFDNDNDVLPPGLSSSESDDYMKFPRRKKFSFLTNVPHKDASEQTFDCCQLPGNPDKAKVPSIVYLHKKIRPFIPWNRRFSSAGRNCQ